MGSAKNMERINRIRALAAEGMSQTVIADHIGVSRERIRQICTREGIETMSGRVDWDALDAVLAAADAGMTLQQTCALPTLKITAADLDPSGRYIGGDQVADWPGHIEIAADLGTVQFTGSVVAAGNIVALAGSGVEAAGSIRAGGYINADLGITAGWTIRTVAHIKAGGNIRAGGIVTGGDIEAGGCIAAGASIDVAGGILAGDRITANGYIEAGEGITAGSTVKAGWNIKAKWISCGKRIFAGLLASHKSKPKYKQIRAEIRKGVIARGEHVPSHPAA